MDRFYLSNKVSPPIKKKSNKHNPAIEYQNKLREFSQTNNLEIKMCVVRNMHHFLGPPINSNLREKFAAYYTHIESESKGNWRIRFSILSSLMGKCLIERNSGSFREPEHDQSAHSASLYRSLSRLLRVFEKTGLADVWSSDPLSSLFGEFNRFLLPGWKVRCLIEVCDHLRKGRPSRSDKDFCIWHFLAWFVICSRFWKIMSSPLKSILRPWKKTRLQMSGLCLRCLMTSSLNWSIAIICTICTRSWWIRRITPW